MVRLISLNVERSRHVDRFIPFLKREAADVVCLQELAPGDIPAIQAATGLAHHHYVPMALHPADGQAFGVGILAREPFAGVDVVRYAGLGDGATAFDRATPESRLASCRYVVIRAKLGGTGQGITVATTHFPWTPDGEPRPYQADALRDLLAALRGAPLVLTGDFNAPRGGPIFAELAKVWRDCVPVHVTTSIDPDLHRNGPLQLMVDGLFVTPDYEARDVTMHTGVSDHQAISAVIARV